MLSRSALRRLRIWIVSCSSAVEGYQLLVQRLQLLLGGQKFLVGRLVLLVDGQRFLVDRLLLFGVEFHAA